MAATATVIIITAGTITFTNEWLQTHEVNLRIPLATVLAAAVFDTLAHFNDKAATGLAIIVLLGAVTTKFSGKSIANEVRDTFKGKPQLIKAG
jgi:hypothetical protein